MQFNLTKKSIFLTLLFSAFLFCFTQVVFAAKNTGGLVPSSPCQGGENEWFNQ
jgi:hypothetical protein